MTKIELLLDKPVYFAGEPVNGVFKLTHGEHFWEGPIEAKINLTAIGVETATVMKTVTTTKTDPNGNPIQVETQIPRSQQNTFFSKPLDSQLTSLGTPASGGYIKIDKGTRETKFQFVLDGELFDSYNGKNVNIAYDLKANLNKKSGIDAHQEISFKVTKKPNMPPTTDPIIENKTDGSITWTMEANNDKFIPGDTIKGSIVLSNPEKKPITVVNVGIRGVEIVNVDNLPPIASSIDNENIATMLKGNWNDGDTMAFDLKVPPNATRSYAGVYSKHYWEMVARVDFQS